MGERDGADNLQVLDPAEKASLLRDVNSNVYERGQYLYVFRRDMGPQQLTIRILACLALLFFAYSIKGGTPCAREDREWLITFCIVMVVFFAILHGIAYLPAAIFGSFSEMVTAARGMGQYAYESFSEVHWCAVLVITLLVSWPIVGFILLIVRGFNPYGELTERELMIRGGISASLLSIGRTVLHLYLCFASIYLLLLLLIVVYFRNSQSRVG